MGYILDAINSILSFKIFDISLIMFMFLIGGMWIMICTRFANVTMLPLSLKNAFFPKKNKGKNLGSDGVSSMTTVMAQLAGNLGIGNFAGAAFALYYGGPGVVVWFFIIAFFCTAIKFGEVVLGHKYRVINKDGTILGGPFYFIKSGISNKKIAYGISIVSAILMAFVTIGPASLQINQINAIFFDDVSSKAAVVFSILVAILTLGILLGGLKRIGAAADVLVPIMGLLYIAGCSYIIALNSKNLPAVLSEIFRSAFCLKTGGVAISITILIAIQRMVNATDAGAGFASIMQSGSNVKSSGEQGMMAFFDSFIVAIIMAAGAIVIMVSNVPYDNPKYLGLIAVKYAFGMVGKSFGYMLNFIAMLFGFTTIFATGYYFQQAMSYIFGAKAKNLYAVMFVFVYTILSFSDTTKVLYFSDTFYGITVVVNIIFIIYMWKTVKKSLDEYRDILKK